MKKTLSTLAWLVYVLLLGAALWRLHVNGMASLGWLATSAIIMIIRAPYAKQVKGNAIDEKRAVARERGLLALVAIGGNALPLIHLATGALKPFNYALPGWAAIVGAVLLVPGAWLFWRSHADLGRNWSPTTELREDHSLTTTGVYAKIRHPMYTAIFILLGIQPLFVQNWIAGFAGVVTFGVLYVVRVGYEERMMLDRFGAAYEAYCQRAGRLIPTLG
ncbi:MAG: protein-S-isoprenylcysteine O-methyltransferase [Pseudomonadota bacterium]